MKTDELVKDFLFTTDLVISGGDFVVSESDDQHVEHVLRAEPGQFRQWPLIGVGVTKLNNASISRQKLVNSIRLQLLADNFNVKTVDVKGGENLTITIDARRKK